MKGEERRKKLYQLISDSKEPVSGTSLAKVLHVSRQVIVQDIALLRANGVEILSMNKGYLLQERTYKKRVLKVIHEDDEVDAELKAIVDLGGKVEDVFVYHKVYGVIRAPMHISSRKDIKKYMEEISSGKSSFLKNVTAGYHYHTITAESEETLNQIQQQLQEMGFLAKLQDDEPVDFRNRV